MRQVLLVLLGSGIGGVARYLSAQLALKVLGAGFPWGTLSVNVIGSFLIVLIMQLSLKGAAMSADARLFLTTGVMGGLTTYSTFTYETVKLFDEGAALTGGLYMLATVLACLLAGGLGLVVARALAGS